jgi:hypothetical protein
MGDISVGSGSAISQFISRNSMSARELSKVDELNVTVSNGDGQYKVSAEAQYLFEIQVYFNKLDDHEQDRTIEYFAKSNDSLDNTVADTLRKTQEFIRGLRDGTIKINREDDSSQASKLLDPNFVIDGTTEIGVRPNGPEIFRLDGKKDYNAALGSEQNDDLKKQLDTLEKATSGLLRNRDAANLFGSVSNALVYADNIFLSADDVLHYNYAIAQAKKTIEFVTAPDDLKAALSDLLSKSIVWQDVQQSKTIFDNRKLIDNARVGHLAADAVRMGSAAQAFNQQLIGTFKSSENSFLDAGSLIKRMLVEQPDLIRFSANKIDEALTFYRNHNAQYDKALNRGYYEPEPKWKDPLTDDDRKIFAASKSYALKVIAEIQGYVTNKQT